MFTVTISETEKICVHSKYDSGTHLGFFAGLRSKGEYVSETPEEFLTKEQISKLEMILLMEIKKMLDEYKRV